MSIIFTPATAEVTTENIVLTRAPFPKTFHVVGDLDTDEAIDIYIVDELGNTNALYDEFGTAVTMTSVSPPLTIPSPITLKFHKPVTDNEVSIQLVEQAV